MSDFRLTDAQRRAVELRGMPILVSAAAGSGKTRVLTERLIARVLEGEDITRFLVITFTKAAAAELRGRILAELNARLAADPGSPWLRRQSAHLYRAQIGTIDSFCRTVVREHAHMLGISPGFSVLDEERSDVMRRRALDDVLDRAYETIRQDDGLRQLADSVGAGRDDTRLAEVVIALHDQLRSRAWPEKWAAEQLAALDAAGLTDAGGTVWGRSLLEELRTDAAYYAGELDDAVLAMSGPDDAPFFGGYAASFSDAALWFRDAARAADEGWDRASGFVRAPFPRLGRVKKDGDEALKERVKTVWDRAKDRQKKYAALLHGTSGELLRDIRRTKPALEALMALVTALDREYAARKRRADVCDFSDLEHFCIKLLCDEETGGASPLAGELSQRFSEVMVDEYQDVNAVQELIFRRVSGEGQRLFMVGDVKQSIYRFRLAEPEIFNAKLRAFTAENSEGRVLLRENFRSRGAVLDACNAVFERIMSPALGDIVYDDDARLVQGAEYPEAGEVRPELCIVDVGAAEEEAEAEETPNERQAEARYVARRIRAMVEGGETVSDGAGGTRPVRYGDIALLLRTPGTSGAVFRLALAEEGVPVSAQQGGVFFTQPEVSFALSMLAVADNPRQDVPLIAAMRGLPFGFTPDELTAVRAAGRGDLWDALLLRAETDEKCARFVGAVKALRDLARESPTESVLRWLYDRTGLLAVCAVMPDAGQRYAALMELYDYARRYEEDGGRGLMRFLSWLQSLEEHGIEPAAASNEDAVQLMSIHKSKGLEFPVVVVADNGHRWNGGGAGQVLCHGELGLGMRITDAARGAQWPTLAYRAISRRLAREELSEQERVLYVAMTRARERLIMTCACKNAAEKLDTMPRSDGPIPTQLLDGASSTMPWLMRAAAADGGRTLRIVVTAPEDPAAVGARPTDTHVPAQTGDTDVLAGRLAWRYPYAAAVTLPSKLTATGVQNALETRDPEALSLEEKAPRRFRRPEPGRGAAPLTGAERGVAAHLVMQYIDLARTGSEAGIAEEIARLRAKGFLDERQAAAVRPRDILAFFRSEIGQRVLRADDVRREFRFSLLCPAERWFPDSPPGEQILLQGVVDCCIEEAGRLTIIDFKTNAQIEPGRHTEQLRTYAEAMSRILQKPVAGAVLWYLRKRTAVPVSLT